MQHKRNSAFGVASRFGMNAVAGFGRLSLLLILAMCSALELGGCRQEGVLDPQGPIASAQRLLVFNATEIMLIVVAPVLLATVGFAWWFRASNAQTLVVFLVIGGSIWIISSLDANMMMTMPGDIPR